MPLGSIIYIKEDGGTGITEWEEFVYIGRV